MMKKLLLFFMMLAMAVPLWAGEKTVTISRNDISQLGVYYIDKGGITMTFSSGMNNPNYLVEHQQVVFYIRSNNYVIKKIVFHCLDNTTENDLDAFYWGPSTISEGDVGAYTPTGSYTYTPGGYIGTWVGGSVDSKNVAFMTKGRPVRFGSVEITYEKEFGDIFELVTSDLELASGNKYTIVNQWYGYAMSTFMNDEYNTIGRTKISFVPNTNKRKVIINDETRIVTLQGGTNVNDRPWFINGGDDATLKRAGALSGGANSTRGHTLSFERYNSSSYKEYFPVKIEIGQEADNYPALIRFAGTSGNYASTDQEYAIGHNNAYSYFKTLRYTGNNADTYATYQRVYLYKPAQSYEVTTECLPDGNCGYITLGSGVLTDNQGNSTSQQFDNVTFFVGPTDGYGVGQVIVTNPDDPNDQGTILDPVNTSDFGNDYSFTMPANNVKITANFVAPNNIFTVSNPADGGDFNFISGYTDFNGNTMSNAGKTVTFSIEPAEGYSLNSVTYTNNGVTETLQPDANGVYTFTMPGNDVTLTANYTLAPDLYLLGTAMGRTYWVPAGPKFNYDGTNNEYYLDVYFKGIEATGNQFGFFSLARRIDTGITWQTAASDEGNWDLTKGEYRLAAQWNDYEVQAGSTQVPLYAGSSTENNAFKIPAGVYRIKVNQAMTQMSIEEIPISLTFTPESGASAMLGESIDVSFTSDLGTIVQGIAQPYGITEPDATYNYSTTHGNTTSQVVTGNSLTITQEGETTVNANAKIGYITATGTADYEIIGDLYLLGTANGMDSWQPYGPKFTYDATTETYSLDVYFTGLNVTAADEGYGYFSLSSVISDPNNPNWNDIPNSARYNAQYDDFPITGLAYNQSVTNNLYQTNPNYAFKIDPGVYTITVNKGKTEVTVTKHELTLSFNPPSGSTVAAGDPVNITSNLDQLVHGINANEDNATFTYATSTDGSLPTPNTAGSTVNITAVGATTTVNAQAALGYIVVSGNAYYTVPAPEVYDIFTIVDPEEAGTITAPSGDIAGATVNFTVTDADPSLFTLLDVEVVDGNNAIVETFEPSADGNYSFTMPDDEVTIYADYVRTPYNVTTSWSPSEGGAIWLNGVNTPQTVSVPNADQVVFGVAPADGYVLTSFTVTNTATGQEITPTPTGISNEYTFTMPAGNVIIMANFLVKYNIITQCTPPEGGSIDNVVSSAAAGETVTFTVTPNIGWTLTGLTVTDASGGDVTVTDNGGGTYSFTMPEANVTVTANYGLTGVIFKIVTDPSEIVEEEYYTMITRKGDRVLNSIAPNATPNYYSSTDIVGWVTPGEYDYVKLDGRACFFSPEDVTDSSISSSLYRTGYLKTSGGYIGIEPNVENNGYAHLALYDSKDNVKPFSMSIDTYGAGSTDHYAYIYYDYENSHSNKDAWRAFFDKYSDFEYNSFLLEYARDFHYDTWLYKPAKMYNITTVVTPGETGSSLELYGGAVGNAGAEGSTIIVVPVAGEGYALSSLVVTNDGTGEVVEATPNIDGSYSFIMPGNDVTITADFETGFKIETECEPEDGGEIIVVPSAIAGRTVTFEVWPNDDYVATSVTVTTNGTETLAVDVVDIEDGTYSFEMPASDVIVKVVFDVQASTLQYIEKWDTYESGTRVTVSDELIGTWMAKQYLWAKDQYPQRSNVYLERDVDVDPYDFIRNSLKREVGDNYFIPWQPDEWDQSNWVMLDFSQIPRFADWEENTESYLAMREAMQTFVDNKIEAGTITGRYLCEGEPIDAEVAPGDYPKVQHIIVLEKLPEVVEPVTTPQTTLGYPGYVQDPKEWRGRFYDDPSKYSYNHYMSYNFNKDNTKARGTQLNEDALVYWFEQGIVLDSDTRYFFMNPKDQEVAQVCGVWVGQKQFEFNGETILGDVFDSYAFSPEEGVNQLGFYGAFYVPSRVSGDDLGGWKFNRLISDNEETNPIYGMPGIDDGKGLNGELKVGEAYIFHAAIQYPYVPVDEPSKAPLRDLEPYGSDPEYYTVYPLDLMSPGDAFTAVSEVKSQESTEIDSIRYYNIMGQESDVPFDGINIRVIRYKDGSMISKKILR